jgi:hypothetical protein
MWHRKLERCGGELGLGGSSWSWLLEYDFSSVSLNYLFNPGVNNFTFNGTEWKKMTNQDWRRLNFIYFKIECIFGLPFSVAPFPLAYMCPWLVILPL